MKQDPAAACGCSPVLKWPRLTLPAVSYFIQFLEDAVKKGTREMTLTARLPGELRDKQENSVLVSAVPRATRWEAFRE